MLMRSIFLSALLLAACTQPIPLPPPPGGPLPPIGAVTLTAALPVTTAGSTMVLTLANGSQQTIGYNLCTSSLETASGAPVPTGLVCTMELRTLQPGGTASFNYPLPANLADGRYRFSTNVERMPAGDRGTVTSNTFDVR